MRILWSWIVVSLLGASPAFAQLSSELVVSGFAAPVAVVQDPTQPGVQFVVEQGGLIRTVLNNQIQMTDFLDVSALVLSGGERGLLGLAFAPDYATSRRFFINYTRQPDGHTVVARYLRSATDPLQADPASAFVLQWPNEMNPSVRQPFIAQPFANHNAGDLQFGSDGYLYIPLGDGGSGNDPSHHAQNPMRLLGKTLRVDVDVPTTDPEGYDVPPDNPFVGQGGVLPEIWAFGLRNPFRFTVDLIARGGNGALLIADVGQSTFEEVDYEPFGAGGRNYGWRNREGAHDNVTSLPPAYTPLVDPIVEYSHAVGNVITGGVVYRGTALGVGFFGRYFFADFGARRMWSVGLIVDQATGEAQAGEIIEHTAELGGGAVVGNVSAFGIRSDCEVLYLDYSGSLRRIVNASGGPAPMCPTSPDPFLTQGGGIFVNGTWVARSHASAAGAGLGGSSSGAGSGGVVGTGGSCTTPQPAPNWVCVNGGWLPPDHPFVLGSGTGGGGTGGTGGTTGGTGGTGGTTAGCTTPQPAGNWVCVNGGWLPPDHPGAQGTGSGGGGTGGTGGTTGGTGGTGGTTAGCTTPQPASTWLCVGDGWLPPDHPLALGAGSGGGTTGGTGGTGGTTAGCTTPQPASTWVCVGTGWLPPDHPGVTGGGSGGGG
jgi:glucose/arabinose dehydrogenase